MKKTALLLALLMLLLTGCGEAPSETSSLDDTSNTSSAVSYGEPPEEGNELWDELVIAHPEEITRIQMLKMSVHDDWMQNLSSSGEIEEFLTWFSPETFPFCDTEPPLPIDMYPGAVGGAIVSFRFKNGKHISVLIYPNGVVEKLEEGKSLFLPFTKDVQVYLQYLEENNELKTAFSGGFLRL